MVPKRVYADLDETFYLDAGPDPAPDPGPSFTLLVNNKKKQLFSVSLSLQM